jgi:hypothetical protein
VPNFSANLGMENGFQIGPSHTVGENETSHCRPIEGPGFVEYVIAKPLSYFLQRGSPRFNDVAGYDVSIDNVSTKAQEQVRNCRLTAGDAASQADSIRPICDRAYSIGSI